MRAATGWWILAAACVAGGCRPSGDGWADGPGLFSLGRPSDRAPADAEGYTILLTVFGDADHVAHSMRSKKLTENSTRWKGLFVVHEDRRSALYRGRYPTVEAARKDLAATRAWTSPAGNRPFEFATIVKRAGESPGPPEWDLANADGYYTVVIAVFYDVPEGGFTSRKEYAVENCRDLRARGVEAYYHHGPVTSLVTIGSFPKSAFRMVEVRPDELTAVLDDERMKRTMKDWPHLAVNGSQEKLKVLNEQTGKIEERITATYVTGIPGRSGSPPEPGPHRPGDVQPR